MRKGCRARGCPAALRLNHCCDTARKSRSCSREKLSGSWCLNRTCRGARPWALGKGLGGVIPRFAASLDPKRTRQEGTSLYTDPRHRHPACCHPICQLFRVPTCATPIRHDPGCATSSLASTACTKCCFAHQAMAGVSILEEVGPGDGVRTHTAPECILQSDETMASTAVVYGCCGGPHVHRPCRAAGHACDRDGSQHVCGRPRGVIRSLPDVHKSAAAAQVGRTPQLSWFPKRRSRRASRQPPGPQRVPPAGTSAACACGWR